MEPERWLGDCGDLIDSLWYLTLERVVQERMNVLCDVLGVPWVRVGELFGTDLPPFPYDEMCRDL